MRQKPVNLKKHRNDIIRMAAELVLERCELSSEVKDIIFVDKEKALTLLDNAKIAKSFVSMVEDNDLKL